MDNRIDLKGRRVLVTGGSRGIGAGIARAMAACGAHLLINHLGDDARAQSLGEALRREYGVNVWVYGADISLRQEVAALFRMADEQLGGVDVLVNNAGCETVDHALDLDLKDWDRIFNVNLRGAFICAQEAGKRMVAQDRGVILNISSIHDKVPRKGLIHYCSAKAGLNMMTKCLALELAPHQVRVVAVSPGAIETEMNREEIEKFGREKFNGWIPAGRVGVVDDVAWTCAFLASDLAAYMTATEIYIDGGYKESTIPYDPRPKK
ncbi:MAG TPA: glucose 1-dehydrogenase [Puia sp.]|uniref:SDR family NAD(P)-dependent oxidoreductase n=1 Tax=Puia sp. TaxID=2045100 RepID=UPI002B8FA505|nr:glucose 1-dehydrogenase [Puia sp.]HVU94470.1 glucose 1-dehydrogenase [Puia sp.]